MPPNEKHETRDKCLRKLRNTLHAGERVHYFAVHGLPKHTVLSILGLSDYERHGQLIRILTFPNKTVFMTYFIADNENSLLYMFLSIVLYSPHTNLPLSASEVELFIIQNE